MRQLSLFEPQSGPSAKAQNWESAVPVAPANTSNRHWIMLRDAVDLGVTLLAVLYVQWDVRKTGEAVIFVPLTGSTLKGPDFLEDVFNPFHVEVAAIARAHGIKHFRAATTVAWREETRAVVRGPFNGQEGLRRPS